MFLLYEGLFFNEKEKEIIKSLEPKPLKNVVEEPHITFKFKPTKEEIYNQIAGSEFEIEIVGYGNDGKNSGFQVNLPY